MKKESKSSQINERLKSFLQKYAPNPPPASNLEYLQISETIENLPSKTVWARVMGRFFLPAFALSVLFGLTLYHFLEKRSTPVPFETASSFPISLLLFDPTFSDDEFLSPADDWNTLAAVVSNQPNE